MTATPANSLHSPDRPEEEYPHQRLTGLIIGSFLEVHHSQGYGYFEAVYRNGLAVELAYRGVASAQEVPYEIFHRGVRIGLYRADLIVEGTILVEVKAGLLPDPVAPVQLLNYLKASRLPVGLLLHCGPRPSIKRIVSSKGLIENLR